MLKLTTLSLALLFSSSVFSQIENLPESPNINNNSELNSDLLPIPQPEQSPLDKTSPLDRPTIPQNPSIPKLTPPNIPNNPITPIPDLKKNSPFDSDTPSLPIPERNDGNKAPSNAEILSSLFSNTKVSTDAQVTQVRLLNLESLKKSGISNDSLFSFIDDYTSFAQNFFFKFPPSDSKIIFAVSVKPVLQAGISKAAELGITLNSHKDLINFCKKTPTYCSLTSVQSIANPSFKKNVLTSFEQSLYQKDFEIFWNNFNYNGEVNFYFEISLKSN